MCERNGTTSTNLLKTDVSLAITGVAGPDGGSNDTPGGLVWMGLGTPEKVIAENFFGNLTEKGIKKHEHKLH